MSETKRDITGHCGTCPDLSRGQSGGLTGDKYGGTRGTACPPLSPPPAGGFLAKTAETGGNPVFGYRVLILKDEASPLWFIRCADPCAYGGCEGWTQNGVCWLGSAPTQQRAAALALRYGYEVVR